MAMENALNQILRTRVFVDANWRWDIEYMKNCFSVLLNDKGEGRGDLVAV